MRQTYVVTYDISDPKRLRKVYELMLGYGDHLQLSVFRCELDRTELVALKSQLGKLIHHSADQVMFVDVGPTDGRGSTSIDAMGKPYLFAERSALVL